MWLQMECMPGPLSSPVIMAPDDCMHLGGQVHKLSPPTFGVVKRAPRSSNELSPRGSIEVVTRFSNDMRQVPSVGTRGVTDLLSPAYPVQESSLGFNVLELRTPLDPTRFPESFPHNQHPHRDDGLSVIGFFFSSPFHSRPHQHPTSFPTPFHPRTHTSIPPHPRLRPIDSCD